MSAPAAARQSAASHCDVFVIGGGPAGSTIAALLAERGWNVVIAEKERHPRFHIGESLLPMNLPLFDRLGVSEQVARIGLIKYGAEFTSPQHAKPVTLNFSNAWDKAYPSAFQVRRSQFDEILFRNSATKGAQTIEACRVTKVEFPAGDDVRITANLGDGTTREWGARFCVDASGRDTFLANRFGIKRRNPRHNSAAIYGHFEGAQRLPGKEEGNISIFWFEHGWFWFIPLIDGATSVGAVCWPYYMRTRKTDPARFLLDTIALCPALAQRLRDATLTTGATATGNYSYYSERMYGDRHIMLGDAFAFVDPVFSSGVMLAMNSAFVGADAVDASLRDPATADAALMRFDENVRSGVKEFSWFIFRMTNPTIRDLFMGPRNLLRMEEALLSLLAGDLFRGTPIHWSLWAFKCVYYLSNLAHPRRTFNAWRGRRRAIRGRREESPALA
ncbi:MAG: NAD(P)/FAD-dependent oxidoreductase [Betaproteobacteria bacterium]